MAEDANLVRQSSGLVDIGPLSEPDQTAYPTDPRVDALVTQLIARVAEKWTMLIIDELHESGRLRFTQLCKMIPGISYKMLTQTLRKMEREGLVNRTVHAEVPPRVEYELSAMGTSLGASFCGVWKWAAHNLDAVEKARTDFDADE